MLIQGQIQTSINIGTLLDTTTDCLRFVTEFFEVISQSGPHIYHSALQLAPRSSRIWKLYKKHIYSPLARVVTGIPDSWDSCTANAAVETGDCDAVWSPCGKFIAVPFVGGIQIRDSNTLEGLSILRFFSEHYHAKSLAFSPNGCLLACSYQYE